MHNDLSKLKHYFSDWPAKLVSRYTKIPPQRWADIKCGRVKITEIEVIALKDIMNKMEC